MVNNPVEAMKCPKCDASDVFKFDHDIYIVDKDDDFLRRKLYGCNLCKNMFTFIGDKKEPKKMNKNVDVINNVRGVFSDISKNCERIVGGASMKKK